MQAGITVIEADSFDRPALDAMVAQTNVVISTVGPFLKYGDALVAACAASGTHYVDITGETMFVRHNIDNHNEAAVETGAKVGGCACRCASVCGGGFGLPVCQFGCVLCLFVSWVCICARVYPPVCV